jgi:hypothetical protein
MSLVYYVFLKISFSLVNELSYPCETIQRWIKCKIVGQDFGERDHVVYAV